MDDTGLRVLVRRILRDDYSADDFSTLLLALRGRSGGRQTIQEIGNFIAHRAERDQGIATERAEDFFIHMQFHAIRFVEKRTVDLSDLPPFFPQYLDATFRLTDDDILRRDTGLNRRQAKRALETTKNHILTDPSSGKLFILPTADDVVILRCLTRYIISKPAFTGDMFFREMISILRAQNLLRASEVPHFSVHKNTLILYVVALLHGCTLRFGKGNYAWLMADIDFETATIEVNSTVWSPNSPRIGFGWPIFTTSCNGSKSCTPELQSHARWLFYLEVTRERRLARFT